MTEIYNDIPELLNLTQYFAIFHYIKTPTVIPMYYYMSRVPLLYCTVQYKVRYKRF